jgi:hypothetical protein
VELHYAALLRPWRHRIEIRSVSTLGGHPVLSDFFGRDKRCVWVHVGFPERGGLPPGRTLMVATDVRGSGCA